MAKAIKPASEKAAAKPATPRKAAATASDANNQKKAGATAPVSLPVDQAAAGDTPASNPSIDPAANAAPSQVEKVAPLLERREGFYPGMGRFPVDWKPTPRLEEPAPDGAELEQTTAETGGDEPLQSPAWGLPDIAEFPAELTLTNNTRNRVVVRHLNVHLPQFSSKTVICPTAEKYNAIQREYAGRAVREGWDSDKGLQVNHGDDQD
jgi:hypothetical protein